MSGRVSPPATRCRALEQLELEHDNLAEALRWLLEQSGPDAIELASLLWPYWYQRGYYREARDAFEQVLASAHDVPARRDAPRRSGSRGSRVSAMRLRQSLRAICGARWS